MFAPRLKQSDALFNMFIIVEDKDKEASFVFPSDGDKTKVDSVRDFAFPCVHRSNDIEEYTMLFTDRGANLDFVFCRYIPSAHKCLCLCSLKPWFEIHHSIVETIANSQLHNTSKQDKLENFLTKIRSIPLPDGLSHLSIPKPIDEGTLQFNIPLHTSPNIYKTYIAEFFCALEKDVWIDVFASVLLERRILFHANHLHRLTGCILGLLSLIYPLSWVHAIFPILSEKMLDCAGNPSPFIAGIHTCHIQRVLPMLSEGTRVVNLDIGKSYITDVYCPESMQSNDTQTKSSVETLPKRLRNYLRNNWTTVAVPNNANQTNDSSLAIADHFKSIFLKTMVAILGNYRSTLVKSHVDKEITMDVEKFKMSRGTELAPFLAQVYESQMVRTFCDHRVELLSSKQLITDDFEDAASSFDMKDISKNKLKSVIINKVRQFAPRKKPSSTTKLYRSDSDPMIHSIEIQHSTPPKNSVDASKNGITSLAEIRPQRYHIIEDGILEKALRRSGSAQNIHSVCDPDVIPFQARRGPPPLSPPHKPASPPPVGNMIDLSIPPPISPRTTSSTTTSPQSKFSPARPLNPPDYQLPIIPPMKLRRGTGVELREHQAERIKSQLPPPRPPPLKPQQAAAINQQQPQNPTYVISMVDEINRSGDIFGAAQMSHPERKKSATLGRSPPTVPPKPAQAAILRKSLYQNLIADFDPLSANTSPQEQQQQQSPSDGNTVDQQPDLLLPMDAHLPKRQERWSPQGIQLQCPQPFGMSPTAAVQPIQLRSVPQSNSNTSSTSESRYYTCYDFEGLDPFSPNPPK